MELGNKGGKSICARSKNLEEYFAAEWVDQQQVSPRSGNKKRDF